MRFGYACINLSMYSKFSTCRMATFEREGIKYVREIMLWNFRRVLDILEWNIQWDVPLYRLSSDLVPFGSHPVMCDWKWWEDPVTIELTEKARKLVKDNNLRITIHPGQFNNLSSPSKDVVESTFRDLTHQARMLELFGGKDMILHVGGVYEGKTPAKQRFKERFRELPENIRGYLRIENDDKSYNIYDVFEVCEELGAVPCFDYHHDLCLRSISIDEVKVGLNKLWKGERMKMHLSSGKSGLRDRAHANYISKETWDMFSQDFGDWDIDLMLETKMKNIAVFDLRHLIATGEHL